MTLVSQVVKHTLSTGYLTAEAEAVLTRQFDSGYNLEDITALTLLQRAVMAGSVKRLSRPCTASHLAGDRPIPEPAPASKSRGLQIIP